MSTQRRKNVHGKGGVRFKAAYTKSKYESMLRTLVTDLIVKGSVTVTKTTARDLVVLADRLVTYAKKGDLANRRQAARYVRDVWADEANKVTALQKLFGEIATAQKDRNGGYTRVLKVANRRGDNAPMALVTWSK
jgi:large subunit ribosomal protein L17